MSVKRITSKQKWNGFVQKVAPGAFFQGWEWGEVEGENGHKVTRYGLYVKDELMGCAQAIEVRAKRGNYLHVRHGPVFLELQEDYIRELVNFLRREAEKLGLDFIRISPLIKANEAQRAGPLQETGFRRAPIHNMDAEVTYVIDLNASLEEILMGMRKNTRRSIRKAKKIKKLQVESGVKEEQIRDFLSLFKKTAEEKSFVFERGIETEVKVFKKENQCEIIVAYYGGEPVAGALISYWGNQAIYRYAASSEVGKKIPATYLVQWMAIKSAHARGLAYYNLWGGIADISEKDHPWYGLTVFKRGFGGEKKEYLHAQDLPVLKTYWITYAMEKVVKYIRGYDTFLGLRAPTFLRELFNV